METNIWVCKGCSVSPCILDSGRGINYAPYRCPLGLSEKDTDWQQKQPSEEPPVKPPLGLTPLAIFKEQRKIDILNAMTRYTSAKQRIPQEWIDELCSLVED